MAALPLTPVAFASLLAIGLLHAGCDRRAELSQAGQLKRELDETRTKLADAEKALASKGDALTLATEARDAARQSLAQATTALAERDALLRATQAELDAIKKRDAFVFAEARAQQQQGRNVIALAAFEKFLKDFPESPLAPLATAAIGEIHTQNQRDQQRWTAAVDPKRKEREITALFRDGLLTPKELAPWIKRKTRAQVVALLGKPSHIFPNGVEIGYDDRIVNPATGRRTMLVISFDADIVSTLRAEYSGQRLIP